MQDEITLKSHAIYVRLPRNMHQVAMQSDSNSGVFCVILQHMVIGIAA